METTVYTPKQAWEKLGIGRTTFYHLLKEGKIRFFKNGSRYLIPESSISEFIEEQTAQCMKAGDQ